MRKFALMALILPSLANALSCGTNQTLNSANTACVCLPNFHMAKDGLSCLTTQGIALEANDAMKGGIAGYDITSPSTINVQLNASENAALKNSYTSSNANNGGLNGFGTAKSTDCSTYVPNLAAPDTRKDAECAAVNDLNKNPVGKYASKTGFNKNDAAFGSAAYKTASADPFSVITATNATVNNACTTVTKTTDPTYRQGQCIKVASPDAAICTSLINPVVTVENFCNASGTGVSRGFYGYKDPTTGAYAIHTGSSDGAFSISYSCSPPDPNGNRTSIQATVDVAVGTFTGGCGCTAGHSPINLTFAPGVSVPPVTAQVACDGTWNGWLGGCSVNAVYATVWYDGVSDQVFVQGTANQMAYGERGYVSSCPSGQTFHPATVLSYTYSNRGNSKTIYYEASPSYCGATNPSPIINNTANIKTSFKAGTTYVCPTGAYGWGSTFNTQCAYVTCPTGYTVYASGYGDFACMLPPPQMLHYAPFDHYTGGAGVRSKLVDTPVESNPSCADLQAKTANNGVSNVTYPAVLKTSYSCPTNWTMTGTAAPYNCDFQPPPYASTVTNTYSCPSGVLTGGTNCTVQPPTYTAFATDIYTCNVGDVITGGTCTNGGVKSAGTGSAGESCKYVSISATPTYTCEAGLSLNGALCYTNPSLASTLTVVDNVNVFAPISTTYLCDANHTLSGTQCIPKAPVTCDYQPPSIPALETMHYKCMPSVSGNYTLTYANPAVDTNPVSLCVGNQLTKAANLANRVCPVNYTWVAANNRCEYQRPNYTAW